MKNGKSDKVDNKYTALTLTEEERYKQARKVDIFELGTALGKSEAMHKLDFLKILPHSEDKYFYERQAERYKIQR